MKILLAEDHNIVRNGIRMLLEIEDSFTVVAEAASGTEVLELLKATPDVDLLLTDINMPGIDGISLIKEVLTINPLLRIAILSMHDNEKYVHQAFLEGASGYLLKNVSAEELVFSLKYISSGGKYLCAELAMNMLDNLIHQKQHQYSKQELSVDFTSREIEILQFIGDGLTNSEISDKLFLSKRTIEGHRQSLLEKTGSKNTATLIRFAVLNGIIQ